MKQFTKRLGSFLIVIGSIVTGLSASANLHKHQTELFSRIEKVQSRFELENQKESEEHKNKEKLSQYYPWYNWPNWNNWNNWLNHWNNWYNY